MCARFEYLKGTREKLVAHPVKAKDNKSIFMNFIRFSLAYPNKVYAVRSEAEPPHKLMLK
jgi:hypothetical protein